MVCAELGKNFPETPSPSRSMETGAMGGLMMRLARASRQPASRVHHRPAEMAKARIASEVGCAAKQGQARNQKQQKSEDSDGNVKEIDNRIGDRGQRESVQIRGARSEQNQKTI